MCQAFPRRLRTGPLNGMSSDAEVLKGQAPEAATIEELVAFAIPASMPANGRSAGAEWTIYEMNATLVAYRGESDGDYHLVISGDTFATMIAEIPNPSDFTSPSYFADEIAAARRDFDSQFATTHEPPRPIPSGWVGGLVDVNVPITLNKLVSLASAMASVA